MFDGSVNLLPSVSRCFFLELARRRVPPRGRAAKVARTHVSQHTYVVRPFEQAHGPLAACLLLQVLVDRMRTLLQPFVLRRLKIELKDQLVEKAHVMCKVRWPKPPPAGFEAPCGPVSGWVLCLLWCCWGSFEDQLVEKAHVDVRGASKPPNSGFSVGDLFTAPGRSGAGCVQSGICP